MCKFADMINAILDVPEIRASVYQWTVADYRALAEDNPAFDHSELIRGIIIKKMSKTSLHETLTDGFAEYLRGNIRAGLWVRQEASLHLADSMPEPDVAVVIGARKDYTGRKPTTAELVVEVAVTSLAADREKAALYAEAGVGEYWIVLAEAGQVEVYRRPEKGVYLTRRIYGRGESIEEIDVTDAPVPVAALFA